MRNKIFHKLPFEVSSQITRFFPRFGAKFLDFTIQTILGSAILNSVVENKTYITLKKIKKFERFLIIPFGFIGDNVILQSSIDALRDFFPNAEIDYITSPITNCLIEKNPNLSKTYPIFTGNFSNLQKDLFLLKEQIRKGNYDICINLCSMFSEKELFPHIQPVLNFNCAHNVRNIKIKKENEINHISLQYYNYLRKAFLNVANPLREERMPPITTYYSDYAIKNAASIAQKLGFFSGRPVIMFNPVTSSIFTILPFQEQVNLLKKIIQMNVLVILCASHSFPEWSNELIKSLPISIRSQIRLLPKELSLDVFSALIDFSDIFITCDTGAMHIAASKKIAASGVNSFRNKTAIFSIFGATSSRTHGYDSFRTGYLPAFQDAPSRCFISESPCRNISCMLKIRKTCKILRCFQGFNTEMLCNAVSTYLKSRPSL